jgi:hypothetical protein
MLFYHRVLVVFKLNRSIHVMQLMQIVVSVFQEKINIFYLNLFYSIGYLFFKSNNESMVFMEYVYLRR